MEKKMTVKKSRRKFRRQNWFWKRKLGDKWRRPGGNQSKMRRKWKSKMKLVNIGYKQQTETRSMLKGLKPAVAHNVEDVNSVDGTAGEGIVVAAGLGAKNILAIETKAKELNLKILNPRALQRAHRVVKAMEKRKEERKKAAEAAKGKVEAEAKAGAKEKPKAEAKAEGEKPKSETKEKMMSKIETKPHEKIKEREVK